MGFKRFTRGFQKAFSSPTKSLITVGTFGLYPAINENKKAAATAATGAAVGFAIGGPAGAVVGGVTGAIKGGTDKRSILDSVAQTAVWSAGVVAAPVLLTKAAASASALKASFLTGNKAAAVTTMGGTAAKAKGGATFMTTLKTAGVMAALSRLGQQAGGFMGLVPVPAQDKPFEQIYEDGRRDLLAAGNERPDSETQGAPAPDTSPLLFIVPALLALGLGAWFVFGRKKKK